MKRYIANLGVSQIFISLLIVILIMSYSSYSIYKSSISNIYDNIKETNKIATQSAMLYFDHVFQTMNNLILTIDRFPPYEYPILENGNLDSYVAHKFIGNLTSTMLQNNYIEEIIVVFNDNDLAFTTEGTIDSRLLFTQKYVSSKYPYSFWNNLIGTEHSLMVLPSTEFVVYSGANSSYQKRNLMIVAGDSQYSTTDKSIFIVIDTSKLMTYFGQTSAIPGSSLKILDQNKNTVFSSDSNLELIEVLNEISNKASNELRAEGLDLRTDNYEYSIFTSEYNGFVYISKIPYEFKNLNTVASGNRTIIFISIASAVLISLFISFYLYRPVRQIMKVLGKENSKGNDFSKIRSGITKIIAENEQYKQQLDYIDNDLRRSTIVKLFDHFSQSEQQTLQVEKYYREIFSSYYAMIGTIQVSDVQLKTSFSKSFSQIEQEIIKRLQLVDLNAHIFHYSSNMFIILLSLEQKVEFEKLSRKISHAITQLEKDELQGYELCCCLSKVFRTTVEHCITAFHEVENASRYIPINNKKKVISVEKLDFVWNLYLPYENMEKLSNYILRGKVEESVQLVKAILHENVERNIHQYHFKYVAQSIFFYMYRNITNTPQSVQQLSQIEDTFLNQLKLHTKSDEIESLLVNVIVELASLSNKTVEVKLNPTFIMEYIELHYMESMYLEDISSMLNTTPKYFSNYFKKTFGINYVEYLNKVRLTYARKMLKDTSLSIGAIGAKTGYINSSTFTTTFRKYYGISPSEYRRQQDEQRLNEKIN